MKSSRSLPQHFESLPLYAIAIIVIGLILTAALLPIWIFGGLIAFLLAIFTFLRPMEGILLLLLWSGFHSHFEFKYNLSWVRFGDDLFLVPLFAGTVYRLVRGRLILEYNRYWKIFIPIIAFSLAGCISALLNQVSLLRLIWSTRQALYYVIIFIILLIERPTEKQLKRIIGLIITIGMVQALAGISQYALDIQKPNYWQQGYGFLWSHNYLGAYVNIVMSLLIAFGFLLVRWRKWILVVLTILFGSLIISTSFQSNLLFWPMLLLIMVRLKRLRFFILIVVIAVSIGFLLYPTDLVQHKIKRIKQKFHPYDPGRIFITKIEFNVWKTAPLFGVGPGNFGSKASLALGSDLLAKHKLDTRTTLEGDMGVTLVERGAVGFACYISIFVLLFLWGSAWQRAFQKPYWKAVALGFQGIVVIIACQAFFTSTWFDAHFPPLLWTISGVLASACRADEFWH